MTSGYFSFIMRKLKLIKQVIPPPQKKITQLLNRDPRISILHFSVPHCCLREKLCHLLSWPSDELSTVENVDDPWVTAIKWPQVHADWCVCCLQRASLVWKKKSPFF